jgi:hypothetical protein
MIYFVAGVFLFIVHLSPLCKRILTKFDTSETETKITKEKQEREPAGDISTVGFTIRVSLWAF